MRARAEVLNGRNHKPERISSGRSEVALMRERGRLAAQNAGTAALRSG